MPIELLSPAQIYQELFIAMSESGLWEDGKTIVDALPRTHPTQILADYRASHKQSGFELKAFVQSHFDFPVSKAADFKSDPQRSAQDHIEILWDLLKREADPIIEGSSLIPLPHPYIVPGGRFNEIYYWDSYFTLLGLDVSGKTELIENMLDNFSYLIDSFGFIPNGNRSYFLGRSQPPFYALMVSLLADQRGDEVYLKYLPFLEKEYAFWMAGQDTLSSHKNAYKRVVDVGSKQALNRYWDDQPFPRDEMYAEDLTLVKDTSRVPEEVYLNIRAACESGWDFSSRWCRDPMRLSTIHTTDLIPVDLNTLLFNLEKTLANAYRQQGDLAHSDFYHEQARLRQSWLLTHCWDEKTGFFRDYDFKQKSQTSVLSLAGTYPLFFKMASDDQAKKTAALIEQRFLKPGGVVSTLNQTGEQWDAPNGWAPLHWITIQGLRHYGFDALAETIKTRWVNLNLKIYHKTGKMLEKYNVEDLDLETGGGEYPVQDGFGWTNGVLLKLLSELPQ